MPFRATPRNRSFLQTSTAPFSFCPRSSFSPSSLHHQVNTKQSKHCLRPQKVTSSELDNCLDLAAINFSTLYRVHTTVERRHRHGHWGPRSYSNSHWLRIRASRDCSPHSIASAPCRYTRLLSCVKRSQRVLCTIRLARPMLWTTMATQQRC